MDEMSLATLSNMLMAKSKQRHEDQEIDFATTEIVVININSDKEYQAPQK